MKKKRNHNFKDLTGQKWNLLKAIDINEEISKEKGYVFWNFKCDCGNITVVRGSRVSCGKTKSCGCLNYKKLPSGEIAKNAKLSFYKHSAKKRNIEFKLSKKQFREIISKNCNYCGEQPKEYEHRGDIIFCNGIDRIDSSKGYIPNNVVTCCRVCNVMKSDLSVEDFYNHIKKVLKNGLY